MSLLRKKDFLYPFFIWLIFILWYFSFFSQFEELRIKFGDFFDCQSFYLFHPSPPAKDKIIIVAIDEESRVHLKKRWPWKRKMIAGLIKNITAGKPKVVGLDIVFSGTSTPEDDEALASALKEYPHIILAYVLKRNLSLPLEKFIKSAKAIGFVNRINEAGRIRKNRVFYIDERREVHYSIDIHILAEYLGISPSKLSVNPSEGVRLGGKLFIPAPSGINFINYLVHPRQFSVFSAYKVLNKEIDSSAFKEKIVLVGATDPLVHDEHLTPLGNFWGVAIIGNSLVMMLSNRFIHTVSLGGVIFIVLILGVLIIFLNQFSLRNSLITTSFIFASLYFLSLYLRSRDIRFDYFTFFFLLLSSSVISNIYRYSYLTYLSNKIKNLAIRDPLTGFFTPRYFLIKIDEELKEKRKELGLIIIKISNYRKLSLSLNFTSLQELIRGFAEIIEKQIKLSFSKAIISRFSQDTFILSIEGRREKLENFLEKFVEKLEKISFYKEDKEIKFSLKGCLFYKKKGIVSTSKDVIVRIESLEKKELSGREKIKIVELEEGVWIDKRHFEESLDFLVRDLEEKNRELEEALKEALQAKKETEEAYFEAISSLVKALEKKDTYTQGHSERVAKYAYAIAKEAGLGEEECQKIYRAALLHDIGKIGIPDYILHKRERLTPEEWKMIRKHEIMSVEILKPIRVLSEILPIILHHHEHFDGTGYPYGLSGDMIPRGAQILAVADAFDAITCGRGYKRGRSAEEAIKELEKNKGTQLNPKYVDALKRVILSSKFNESL